MSPCGRFDPWPALRAVCLAAAVVAPSTALSQQALSPAPTIDVVGTTLRVRLADGSTREGTALVGAVLAVARGGRTIRVRIAGAEPDASDPHGEILLYDFRLITPRGEEPFCAPDPDGRRVGFPLVGRSDPTGILSFTDRRPSSWSAPPAPRASARGSATRHGGRHPTAVP